ncbi:MULTISPECIES: NAD(P)/FAD-dependent oxidoreductase [Brachybacterium]|uniref:NADH:ubiquinone reductase (non-electrogenic) n=1 Tax=Brachybacterium kimchii TaxID=2942909 RepID=A0ABY4N447_9MICO|nr:MULTISPECIES: NAD(P)/FAD-dependent oxidoreductase [Brachybacterium]MCG7310379.1 NAD(P)/FAD-dependent oxidoreductase [Brachybacterium sp. ACRRE]UQN28223.1 NAD(P)/FAD-dependent oxidoreductase [Brachybacterium kimchii]
MFEFPFGSRRTVPAKDGASWPHVIIIGGGFAGANAVLGLRDTRVRVTLIDRNVYKTFQPLLYQVATAGLNPGDVTMFLRGLSLNVPNMRYRQGEVVGVDPEQKVVRLENGTNSPDELSYDYLVLANGATTTYFGTPGAEEHAMPMYTRSQAIAIRDRVFSELERTSRIEDTDRVHVSIVGGGPTGVEIAGALADFRMQELDILYPEMDPGTLQITLLQRGGELIKEFREEFREYAAEELEARGVELRLGHGVKSVGYDFVELDDGSILESDITVWAAGVAIAETVKDWGLPQDSRGRLDVDENLQVKGFPGVYAAGDIAGGENALPQLAQPAIQSGRAVARMIDADVRAQGKGKKPFHYVDLGTMATIGRRAAITELPDLPIAGSIGLSGTVGWFAWLGVHVTKLLGHRNQRAVSMNLLSLYAGTRATHQPNPVVGEVDSIAAATTFREEAQHRLFGPDKQHS